MGYSPTASTALHVHPTVLFEKCLGLRQTPEMTGGTAGYPDKYGGCLVNPCANRGFHSVPGIECFNLVRAVTIFLAQLRKLNKRISPEQGWRPDVKCETATVS